MGIVWKWMGITFDLTKFMVISLQTIEIWERNLNIKREKKIVILYSMFTSELQTCIYRKLALIRFGLHDLK